MKKQFFIANWKSNKTGKEAKEWLHEFTVHSSQFTDSKENTIILCPQFPLLSLCHEFITRHELSLAIGAQDISPFIEGAYTGAVAGKLIREFASYVIIGHSEARKYFHQTQEELSQKVAMALSVGLTPIYCVSEKTEKIPTGVTVVAYEPLAAIGSGRPDNPEDVEAVAGFIKEKNDVLYVLYGGSVTPESVTQYTSLASIQGVLVGGASLSANKFASIIQHA